MITRNRTVFAALAPLLAVACSSVGDPESAPGAQTQSGVTGSVGDPNDEAENPIGAAATGESGASTAGTATGSSASDPEGTSSGTDSDEPGSGSGTATGSTSSGDSPDSGGGESTSPGSGGSPIGTGGAESMPENPVPDDPPVPTSCDTGVANDVYDRYVAPLVVAGQPSSCNQCHLSGVNLGNFVRDTPCASMACLVQAGEVNLEDPTGSAILERIQLADPASGLITEAVVDREYQGFLAWIQYSAQCQTEACGEIADACGGPTDPLGTPQGPLGECTEQELADQFERSVHETLIGRCSGCHDPSGPKYEDAAVLWLDSSDGGALRTMYNLVGRGDLNTAEPASSLLLTKPLAESAGGLPHGGGDKFAGTDDATYIAALQWIEAYSACKNTGDLGTFPEEPAVSIMTPLNGETRSNPVRLDGVAIDAQEGQLLDQVQWQSDRDGALGAASLIAQANLSAGTHTLTFSATDADGNQVSASVAITVQ